jgi:hypothetical protein
MNFGEVRMMLWVGNPDYSKWRYKRRRTVLGLWHQIKKSMWDEHVLICEENLEWLKLRYDAQEVLPEEVSLEDLFKHLPDIPPEKLPPNWKPIMEPVYDDVVPF